MNLDNYNYVFETVQSFLLANSSYSPHVVKGVPLRNKYPLVVISEVDNFILGKTTRFEETTSNFIYEFDIYANNKASGETQIEGIVIARELAGLVDNVMRGFKATRMYARPTPNIDKSLYRIVLRYNKTLNDNRGIF